MGDPWGADIVAHWRPTCDPWDKRGGSMHDPWATHWLSMSDPCANYALWATMGYHGLHMYGPRRVTHGSALESPHGRGCTFLGQRFLNSRVPKVSNYQLRRNLYSYNRFGTSAYKCRSGGTNEFPPQVLYRVRY